MAIEVIEVVKDNETKKIQKKDLPFYASIGWKEKKKTEFEFNNKFPKI